jgi:hypothetical protein
MAVKIPKRKRPPELRVVFDTNALWTGSASDLLKQDVSELINNNSKHKDLRVSWYLPDIVRHERQFQMLAQGLELLPSVRKLERLLGHNLNITEDIVEHRVNETVEKHIQALGLNIISLDNQQVDWDRIASNAAYRKPPFARGEKEKGFRDALLVEDFLQLVLQSPKTPKICRIALVTKDGLVAEAVSERTKDQSNVRILGSLEELKSLINTLVAEVSEEFVSKIQEKAQAYFFELDNKDSLYYKKDIRKTVTERFKQQLRTLPEGGESRENGTWYVSAPRFLKKDGQRVSWASRISVAAKAHIYETTMETPESYPTLTSSPYLTMPYAGNPYVTSPYLTSNPLITAGGLLTTGQQGILGPTIEQPSLPTMRHKQILFKTGKSIFEVIWSVTVTASGKLSSPKIQSVEFIENSWD